MPTEESTPPTLDTGKLVRLAGLAALEVAAAWLLVQWVIAYGSTLYTDNTADNTAEPTVPAIHAHGGHAATASAGDAPTSGGWIFLSVALVAGIALWIARHRIEWAVVLCGGLTVAAVMLLPAVSRTAELSHTAMMARLMILIVVSPALIAEASRREFTPPKRTVVWISIPSAVAYGTAMVVWHLPSTSADISAVTIQLATFAIGLLLWGGILLDTRPELQRLRTVTIYVAGAPAGIIGLALIISARPLGMAHPDTTDLWFGVLTDQRSGGLLMMAIEAVFIIPLLMNAARVRQIVPSVSNANS